MQEEFFWIAFRKKLYTSLEQLQADLYSRSVFYNNERRHSGKYDYGKTPMQTFIYAVSRSGEKLIE
jgi:hypothetical protein